MMENGDTQRADTCIREMLTGQFKGVAGVIHIIDQEDIPAVYIAGRNFNQAGLPLLLRAGCIMYNLYAAEFMDIEIIAQQAGRDVTASCYSHYETGTEAVIPDFTGKFSGQIADRSP